MPLDEDDIESQIRTRILPRMESMRWRPNWDKWVHGRVWQERYREPLVANLKRYVPNWQEAMVLDLGCGMGGTVVRLLQEGVKAIGLEPFHNYCVIGKLRGMRYGLEVPVLCGAGEALPLKDRSVDVIFCIEVIEHVSNPAALLQEIHRIIRPGGFAFLTIPNRWTPYDYHYHLWGISYLPRRSADWLIERVKRGKEDDGSAGVQALSEMHYFSWHSFLALCRTVGFSVFDIREDKLVPYLVQRAGGLRLVTLLSSLGILQFAYRLYRATITDGWQLILSPA